MFKGSIELEICATDYDIERYLDAHLPLIQGVAGCIPNLREEAKREIVKAVRGMYVDSFVPKTALTWAKVFTRTASS